MDTPDVLITVFFGCLFTFIFSTVFIGIYYDERVSNLEYQMEFNKLDLSCERTPLENVFVNYLDVSGKHEKLINGINEWYLKECV